MYRTDADTGSAYSQLSYPEPPSYNNTTSVQPASQVGHEETRSQNTPFIQLSSYMSFNWDTIDPNLHLGVVPQSMGMMPNTGFIGQNMNDKPGVFILNISCLRTLDKSSNRNELQHVPFTQPLYYQQASSS